MSLILSYEPPQNTEPVEVIKMLIFMKKLKISKIVQKAILSHSKYSDEVYSFISTNYELHGFNMMRGECYAPFPVYVDGRELQVVRSTLICL